MVHIRVFINRVFAREKWMFLFEIDKMFGHLLIIYLTFDIIWIIHYWIFFNFGFFICFLFCFWSTNFYTLLLFVVSMTKKKFLSCFGDSRSGLKGSYDSFVNRNIFVWSLANSHAWFPYHISRYSYFKGYLLYTYNTLHINLNIWIYIHNLLYLRTYIFTSLRVVLSY